MTDQESRSTRPGVRWWPFLSILGLTAAAILFVQLVEVKDQQSANMTSILIGLLGALLVLIWLLRFSRLAWRLRKAWTLAYIVGVALFFFAFRIVGVTGDLLPIFAWRFQAAAAPPVVVKHPVDATGQQPVPGLADFTQFFGPERRGRLPGPQLQPDWKAHPPEELWRRSVGAGWSGFAVSGRSAITQEQHGDEEATVCYDVLSGDVRWVHKETARYENTLAGTGPRATPTIDGERVFVQGATGILCCLEVASGAVVWRKDILDDNLASLPEWGVAGSPLIVGALVVVSAGGQDRRSLVAYGKVTGERAWSGGSSPTHWSSPIRVRLAGRDQILMFNARDVTGHDAKNGAVLWSYPWKGGHPHVCMPVPVGDDRVLISSGYGTGCHMLRVAVDASGGLAAKRLWRSLHLKAKFANALVSGGFVYGLDDGILTCLDLATGRRKWKRGRYGHGQILLVGDLLLVTAESGEVALVAPTPDGHRELGRFTAFARKTWNPPAVAGRFLLVRNDAEAACYRLRLRAD